MRIPLDKDQWRKEYRATVDALERIRALELHSMTDAEAWAKITSLNTAGAPWKEPREWSGLVELHALLRRGKRS